MYHNCIHCILINKSIIIIKFFNHTDLETRPRLNASHLKSLTAATPRAWPQVPQYNVATHHNLDPGPINGATHRYHSSQELPPHQSQPMNGSDYRSKTQRMGHKIAQSPLHSLFDIVKMNKEVEPIDRNFVQDIVEIFKNQRIQRRHQFAVLILSPQHQVTMEQRPFCTMTDNTSPTHPPNSTLSDYIVARPTKHKHAEELLLERFDELLNRNASSCQSIVLYTWFVPCEGCTRKIIRVLGQLTYRVTVVYSSKMRNMIEEEERRNTRKLKAAGITVIRRRYEEHLPRAPAKVKKITPLDRTMVLNIDAIMEGFMYEISELLPDSMCNYLDYS